MEMKALRSSALGCFFWRIRVAGFDLAPQNHGGDFALHRDLHSPHNLAALRDGLRSVGVIFCYLVHRISKLSVPPSH